MHTEFSWTVGRWKYSFKKDLKEAGIENMV
jgi:hypothetical protein